MVPAPTVFPTSSPGFDVRRSMFDVRCSMFSVPPPPTHRLTHSPTHPPSRRRNHPVRLRPPIAIKLPHIPHLLDFIQIHVGHDQFIFVAAAHGQELAARITKIRLAVKL